MKKIIAYIAVPAALMAVSCSRMEENGSADMQSSVISLNLNTTEMVATRSAIPDVEGVVTQFDWFFYPDATGTSAPAYHGHFTIGTDGTLTPSGTDTPDDYPNVGDDGIIHLGFNLETNYSDLKGNYYVYILANYAGIDHTSSDLTLATLLAKTMETNWDEQAKGYTAINDFVMDSYSGNDEATYPQLVPLSAATDEDKDGKANLAVDLQRVAAKISFTLNIAKEIVDDETTGTKWRPLTNSANYAAYLVNALTYATVQGEALDAECDSATTHHLSYATSHVKTEKTATETTYYTWEVDPFYTYPVSFDASSNNAPYFKLALPWENVDANGHLTGKGATLFYYKAYLRDEEGKALANFDRNKHYIVTLNVDVLGGTPEDYTVLDTYYYVANWQSPADGTYDGYFAPRYLDIARNIYYIYGADSTTVAVTSSHPISAEITAVSQFKIDGTTSTGISKSEGTVTTEGKKSFTLSYELNTSLSGKKMDITPITWKVNIYHTDKTAVSKEVTIIQYPSIYGELKNTENWATTYLNGTQFPQSNNVTSAITGNNNTIYLGGLGGGQASNTQKTVLTVSTLASLKGTDLAGMIIGDPRVKISTLYSTSSLTVQNLTWARTDLGDTPNYIDNYLIANPSITNVIAPKFMLSSGKYGANGYNSRNTGGTWRAAAERCASYQEDGYPAGRWRLPTEAEIRFCRELQDNEYISLIFTSSNKYWASSGRYYYNGEFLNPTNTTYNSVRCVYDLWYWGDEKYNNDGEKITDESDDKNPATQWLGFMTE